MRLSLMLGAAGLTLVAGALVIATLPTSAPPPPPADAVAIGRIERGISIFNQVHPGEVRFWGAYSGLMPRQRFVVVIYSGDGCDGHPFAVGPFDADANGNARPFVVVPTTAVVSTTASVGLRTSTSLACDRRPTVASGTKANLIFARAVVEADR